MRYLQKIKLLNRKLIPFSIILLSFGLMFHCSMVQSQLYVKDSLIVHFKDSSFIPPKSLSVYSVIDSRTHPGNIISVTEKKQYKYVPVDYFITLPEPLENEIKNMFIQSDNQHNYLIKVADFKVKKRNYFLKPGMYLNSAIWLYYNIGNDSLQFGGELLYEEAYKKFSLKTTKKEPYEQVLGNWQEHFMKDISILTSNIENGTSTTLYNYRYKPYKNKPKNMYLGIDAIFGLNFYAFDGEIQFSQREVNKHFQRKAYGIRYRNENELEAIEFNLLNTHINYRLNEKYLFNAKANLFLGLNKWKDMENNDYTLYDVGMLDLSFSQRFLWNPLDKKSFIFGAGLFESINYVYHYSVRFQPGLLMYLGIKL